MAGRREFREVIREQVSAHGDVGGILLSLVAGPRRDVRVAADGLTHEQIKHALRLAWNHFELLERTEAKRRRSFDGDGQT